MRIGILSAAFWNSGYGIQAKYLAHLLKGLGHDVALFAYTGLQGSPIVSDGIPILPKLHDFMGQDMQMHARAWRADVVIPVMDVFNLVLPNWEGTRLAAWFPVDHFPLSRQATARLPHLFDSLVYSQWGASVCAAAGVPASYLPCMVDTEVYRPHDRSEARAALGWPDDYYIIGMVGANVDVPSRKAFWQQLRAFALFHEEHPSSLLYLHTFLNAGAEQKGENILGMCRQLGLEPGVDILFPDQYQYLLGFPPSHMACLYNAFDVFLGCATGEGFCVPLIEAQACGTPVVTGSWTSMGELCFAGWTVPQARAMVYGKEIDDDLMWGQLEGSKVFPRVSAIVEALEKAWQAKNDDSLREKARSAALAFDVENVARLFWQPRIAEWEGRIANG